MKMSYVITYFLFVVQIAPGFKRDRPVLGHLPLPGKWYTHLEYGNVTKAELNPFFYGVTLVHEPKTYTYQADALSANMHLNKTHYQDQHIYRIEWEPPEKDGSGGYVKWFADGELVYGVYGKSLRAMQTKIPDEPMYLLMNTAVSSHWGFPAPCPTGCDCDCFECGNADCSCALPAGYCDNFPAFFEVDYVRVYQAVDESKHILGCSPEHRPTELFIKGHADRYSNEGSSVPLQPIQRGGASCEDDKNCGNGQCSDRGYCQCYQGFTGPRCRAHDGFYDVDTSKKEKPFTMSRMMFPSSMLVLISLLAVAFVASLSSAIYSQRKSRDTYNKMSVIESPGGRSDPSGGLASKSPGAVVYQKAGADYAMPQSQNVVTYCVIDDRLVDQ